MTKTGVENTNTKTIRIIYYVVLAAIVILAIGFMVTGIVFWSKSTVTVDKKTYADGVMIGLGFAFFFGGSFSSVLFGLFTYVIFGLIFDVKALRNHFVPTTSLSATIKKQVKKPQDIAEEIKSLKELLDMGFITQEEYDNRKKMILGM